MDKDIGIGIAWQLAPLKMCPAHCVALNPTPYPEPPKPPNHNSNIVCFCLNFRGGWGTKIGALVAAASSWALMS